MVTSIRPHERAHAFLMGANILSDKSGMWCGGIPPFISTLRSTAVIGAPILSGLRRMVMMIDHDLIYRTRKGDGVAPSAPSLQLTEMP